MVVKMPQLLQKTLAVATSNSFRALAAGEVVDLELDEELTRLTEQRANIIRTGFVEDGDAVMQTFDTAIHARKDALEQESNGHVDGKMGAMEKANGQGKADG